MRINIKAILAVLLLCGVFLLLINLNNTTSREPSPLAGSSSVTKNSDSVSINNNENQLSGDKRSVIMGSWAYHYTNFETMKSASEVVAIGTIEKVAGTRYLQPAESNPLVNVQIPKTDYLFNIQQFLHGDAPQNITITQIGGITTDGDSVFMDDDPPYQEGEQYLLFLKKGIDSDIYFTPTPQARFIIEDERVFTIKKMSPDITTYVFEVDGLPLEAFLKEAKLQ